MSEPKIHQVNVDPLQGFFFLHYLLASVMATVIDPRQFETSYHVAANLINRELAKFENWKNSVPLITEEIKFQYFGRMRERVLNELAALSKLNAGKMPGVEILKPNQGETKP